MLITVNSTAYLIVGQQYASILDGDSFMLTHLGEDAWTSATANNKCKALITATGIIDRLSLQAGFSESDSARIATVLIANALLDGFDPNFEYENLTMSSQSYSSIKSTYDRSVKQEHLIAGVPSVEAWRYIKPYLNDTGRLDIYRVS